jgi:hypothetical protein
VAQSHLQLKQRGNCIEVATADRTVAVRDSRDPDGPRLAFGVRAWQAFAAKVKGERSLASPFTKTLVRVVPQWLKLLRPMRLLLA